MLLWTPLQTLPTEQVKNISVKVQKNFQVNETFLFQSCYTRVEFSFDDTSQTSRSTLVKMQTLENYPNLVSAQNLIKDTYQSTFEICENSFFQSPINHSILRDLFRLKLSLNA